MTGGLWKVKLLTDDDRVLYVLMDFIASPTLNGVTL